jgi:hypothetical protein
MNNAMRFYRLFFHNVKHEILTHNQHTMAPFMQRVIVRHFNSKGRICEPADGFPENVDVAPLSNDANKLSLF